MDQHARRSRFFAPSMDPQKLQHFLAVYEHKNFSRAAQSTGVTQQAVSKSVARLEDLIGLKLFERGTLGAEPTIYADTLARRAKIILAESRLAAAELSALRGSREGHVRIGLGWSIMPRIGPEAIARFRNRRPGVGISVATGHSGNLYARLLQGDVEFVASAPPREMEIDPAIEVEQLFMDRDVVVLRPAHPLAKGRKPDLEALAKCTWLMDLSLADRWHSICHVFGAAGLKPPADIIDMSSVGLAKSLLTQGDYVCLLSEELVASEVELGILRSFELSEIPLSRPALLARRRGTRLQPPSALMLSIIRHVCHELYPARTT